MLPKVRQALQEAILNKMEETKTDWGTIQKADIKKNWKSPVGWRTLWKIIKDPNYDTMSRTKQKDLLDFFIIPNTIQYGIVTLEKLEDEKAQ